MIDKLGPYRVERILGRGGMGTVYAGVHEGNGSRAAIKMLSLVLADDVNFRERFIAEIETLKKLDHPNIVRLIGDGQQDGYLFYVMELVNGKSLQAELQAKHRFDWPEARAIGLDICKALRHAHDRGIIHRDLKPANLLRSASDQIKLTDFGIAKLFGGSHLTADGSVVGTADYMSPEQAEGKPVTIRTDLYSLGSVLYTLLARRPPFAAGSVAQVVHKLRYEDPPSVRRYAPHVPPEFESLLGELLQKDPQQRPSNVVVLANRLQVVGEGQGQSPTVVSGMDDSHSTRTSPTAIDSTAVSSGGEGFSWNQATVVTDGAPSDPAATGASSAPGDTPAKPAPAEDRFTQLDDEARRRATSQPAGVQHPRGERAQIAFLGLCLALLAAATAWLILPPSADRLYFQIQDVSADQGTEAAKPLIDRFLARFPDDPRAPQVDHLRMDVECDWLRSRLALRHLTSGGSRLEEFERLALDAMRALDGDREQGVHQLRAFVSRYRDTPDPSGPLRDCLAAVRHLLHRAEP